MSKRTDMHYLQDIMESIDAIVEFTEGFDFETFLEDRKTKSATLRELEIIGEAGSRVSDELRTRYSEIPWRMFKDFRNILAHQYFGINVDIVWDIVQHKILPLKAQIRAVQAAGDE
jgi:uncharacterized protein with HEPN domain